MNNERIRIFIVDAHAVIRSGLRDFILAFDEFDLIGEADTGRLAIALCSKLKPDIVLMDMTMPEMDGATATRIIREQNPDSQVIILTGFHQGAFVRAALKAGAIAYLLKSITAEELADAIRNAVAGHPTLAPEATLALIHSATAEPAPGHDLTTREKDVLLLLVKGQNNTQIASELDIALSTVKYHVSNIISKLHASNRTEVAAIAAQYDLLT